MASEHQVPNIPSDIIFDILSRLPIDIEPLCRFKLVSKSWLSVIDDLIIAKVYNKTLSQNYIEIISSFNGVQLLRSKNSDYYSLHLWNPRLTRKHRLLPILWSSPTYTVIEGLVYDSSKDEFKIVIAMTNQPNSDIPNNTPVYVLSFGNKNRWKRLDYFRYHKYSDEPGVVIKGTPYWIVGHDCGSPDVIVYFDPRDERFRELAIPDTGSNLSEVKLTVLGEDLCWVEVRRDTIHLWAVRESSWSKVFVIPQAKEDSFWWPIEKSPYCSGYTPACYEETIASPR